MRAIIYLCIATVLWGLNFHLAKHMLTEVSFIEAGFWRYLICMITLCGIAFKQFPSIEVIRNNLKGATLIGVIGLFGFTIFFFLGVQYTTAVNAALIVSLNPALTLLFSSLILKTKILPKHSIGILIACIGVVYLLTKGHISHLTALRINIGDGFIFIANILFALHHVWVKKYGGTLSNLNLTLLTNGVCLLCIVLILPFFEIGTITTYSAPFWLSALGIGCFGTALAYFLWNKGVQHIGADQAGVFMNIVPLSAGIFAVFFNEDLHLYHFVSGTIIILGIIIMKRKSHAVV